MVPDNRATSCPHSELAAGWALHSLEPAEESLLAAHLLDCPVCTQIVSDTELVGASLGLSIPQVTPSAGLEQRILVLADPAAVAPVIPLRQPTPRTEAGLPRRNKIFTVAAAVVLIAVSMALGTRVAQLDQERDQATSQIMELTDLIQRAADPAWERAFLATEDGQSIGMVLVGQDQVTLVATQLPGNQTDHEIYVLWGLGTGAPQALGPFDVVSDVRPALYRVPSVPDAGEFTGYAISLEQGRSTPAAPTTVKASGQVES
ncbi:MAG: anti-sigma factor domain-containing protein [Pseudonocardiaceae bacterium]